MHFPLHSHQSTSTPHLASLGDAIAVNFGPIQSAERSAAAPLPGANLRQQGLPRQRAPQGGAERVAGGRTWGRGSGQRARGEGQRRWGVGGCASRPGPAPGRLVDVCATNWICFGNVIV